MPEIYATLGPRCSDVETLAAKAILADGAGEGDVIEIDCDESRGEGALSADIIHGE